MDQHDFDEQMQKWRLPLTRAAYHLCGDREAALDLVQDTLLDAYREIDTLRDTQKCGSWFYAILRRKAIRYRNRRVIHAELPEQLASPQSTQTATAAILCEQMSQLPEVDRELLAGKYLLGLSYAELGSALGVAEGVVRVRCFRAKQRLRKLLENAGLNLSDHQPQPASTINPRKVR